MDARITYDLEEMFELRRKGWSYKSLGKKYGRDHSTIVHHCLKNEVYPEARVIPNRPFTYFKKKQKKVFKERNPAIAEKSKKPTTLVCDVCLVHFTGHGKSKRCSYICRQKHKKISNRKFRPEEVVEGMMGKYDALISERPEKNLSYEDYLDKAMRNPAYQHYFQTQRMVIPTDQDSSSYSLD